MSDCDDVYTAIFTILLRRKRNQLIVLYIYEKDKVYFIELFFSTTLLEVEMVGGENVVSFPSFFSSNAYELVCVHVFVCMKSRYEHNGCGKFRFR